MEVRCGSCAKLFRVSDDKITGTGIKFACSRCGEYVKITKEEFEHHNLSQSAVSVLDLFEPKPKTAKAPLQSKEGKPEVSAPAGGVADSRDFDLSTPPDQGVLQEAPSDLFSEPAASAGSAPATEAAAEEHDIFGASEPVTKSKRVSPLEPMPVAEPKPTPELPPAPQPVPAPAIAPKLEPKPETPLPKAAAKAASEPKPAPVRPAAPVAPRPAPPAPSKALKKEIPRPALPAEDQTAKVKVKETPPAPSRSGKMFLYAAILLIVLALAGYGAFTFFRSAPQKEQGAAPALVSIEGLHIVNQAGTPDATGDLLITGVIENSLDVARPAWYVVVDVYNAEGAVLDKIRLLNGKQLYTMRDYDILAKRGMNVQDLKAKTLQEQGVVIPPKGSVKFEVRYVQPPVGVASFNALPQPFDPIRLFQEITSENK